MCSVPANVTLPLVIHIHLTNPPLLTGARRVLQVRVMSYAAYPVGVFFTGTIHSAIDRPAFIKVTEFK